MLISVVFSSFGETSKFRRLCRIVGLQGSYRDGLMNE